MEEDRGQGIRRGRRGIIMTLPPSFALGLTTDEGQIARQVARTRSEMLHFLASPPLNIDDR